MPSYKLKLNYLILPTGAFLCLHAILIAAFPTHTNVVTYPFIAMAPLLAMSAGFRKVRLASSRARLTWMLFSAGLLFWTAGILLSAWEELFEGISTYIAFYSDFAFFLYGIPILLAISSPAKEQRISIFIWLDGLQALVTAYLAYIALFAVVPFSNNAVRPISASLLLLVYNVENLILACAATLRLFAQPRQGEEKAAFQILCSFLWTYALCAAIYNYISATTDNHTMIDVLADIPFLLVVLLASLWRVPHDNPLHATVKKPIALFLDNVSPVFYTVALLILGITVARTHYSIGMAAILVATIAYGIRTSILQSRYIQSQRALEEARDRLELMSLRDGLTNVANRRCFDQTLEQEWNRAVRMQHSLSLLLIDIDYFKNLNDLYGHRSGDRCLIDISAALQSVLPRSGDLLARYGGEEFAVVLPVTNRNGAQSVAQRMQDAVRELQIRNETTIGEFVTVSIGIASYEPPLAGSSAELLEASGQALYQAKQNGRDRIEFSSSGPSADTLSIRARSSSQYAPDIGLPRP